MRAADFGFFDAPFLAFAHRGGALYPPNLHRENTLHAFTQATALGYRYLETDVHATADGVLVAFHDTILDRVTDRQGAIGDLPYAAVRAATVGAADRVPTLDELLSRFPDARFNVDAKSDRAIDLLARVIADHAAYDRICVGSFGVRRLHRLRRLVGPRVASSASSLGVAWNRFVPWVARALDSPAPALQLPIDHLIAGRRVTVLTDRLIAAAHRRGKQVHVWTVDEATVMEHLIDRGVDGIFTDRIDTLRNVLQSRGLWTPA